VNEWEGGGLARMITSIDVISIVSAGERRLDGIPLSFHKHVFPSVSAPTEEPGLI